MCNCLIDTENKLKEIVSEDKKYSNLENLRVRFNNVALLWGKNGVVISKPYLEFEVTGDFISKSGKRIKKKKPLNVTFTYCPLCGEKVEKEGE